MVAIFFLFTLIFSIISIKYSQLLYGYYLNHYTILNGWWLTTLFLSFFNYSIYKPLDETYFIFFIGLFSFNITIFFFKKTNIRNKIPNISIINTKLRRIVEIIIIALIIPYVIKNFYLVLSGTNLAEIHQDYFNGEIVEDSAYKIKSFIIEPLVHILLLLSFYKWSDSTSKYSTKLNFIFILLILLLNTFVTGGRTELLMFVFIYFMVYGFSKLKEFKPYLLTDLKINLFYIIPFFLLLQFISTQRQHGVGESFFNTILGSYTLYVGIFDYYLRHPLIAFNELTWGQTSFESIVILLKSIFRNFFDVSIFTKYKLANEYIQQFVPIGRDFNANANATMYFKFIRDWGYSGIIIGPIILARIYHGLHKLMQSNGLYVLFYIYSCYILTQSTNMFVNSSLFYLLVFIYLGILNKYSPKLKIKNKKSLFF